MKILLNTICVFSFMLLFGSCDYLTTDIKNTGSTFNPKAYFTREAELLNTKGLKIIKTVTKNGSSEQIETDSINWTEELKPFINIDINKLAQIGTYNIDSIFEGSSMIVQYTARDSSVDVKRMKLVFTENNMTSFKAISGNSNLYYTSSDTIEYFGDGNYRISTISKPKLGREITFILTAETEKK